MHILAILRVAFVFPTCLIIEAEACWYSNQNRWQWGQLLNCPTPRTTPVSNDGAVKISYDPATGKQLLAQRFFVRQSISSNVLGNFRKNGLTIREATKTRIPRPSTPTAAPVWSGYP